MNYIALRKLALMGQNYAPGDEIESEGLDHDLVVTYLSRGFMTTNGPMEDLPEDLFLDVMEAWG